MKQKKLPLYYLFSNLNISLEFLPPVTGELLPAEK
jgi:hypothetical protein